MVQTWVSVVISNYNYARFVGEAIESALGQTYPHTEVIVVDDGSTDASREVIERYRGGVRILYKPNGGQASAWNLGFREARGDIVIFLDADDRLHSTAIERVVAHWSPAYTKVQWRLRLIDAEGRTLGGVVPQEDRLPSGDVSHYLWRWSHYPSPPTSGNAFSREFLARVMPIPEQPWRIAADSYLLTCAAVHGPILSLDEVLGDYRIHGHNQWATDRADPRRWLREVEVARRQRALVEALARERGIAARPVEVPWAVKAEMALAVLTPHLLHGDGPAVNRLAVAGRGIRSVLGFPFFPSKVARLRLAAWFTAVAVAPPPLARRLAVWGMAAAGRPAWLRRLLRWGGIWRRGGGDPGG